MNTKERTQLVKELEKEVEIEKVKYNFLEESDYVKRGIALGRINGLLTAINVILTK